MKRLYGIVVLAGLSCYASAQQKNFLYVQTDNKKPFYIKLGAQVFSSSVAGHVVIPELADSVYRLQVGFPRSESPEQEFTYAVAGKDQGFILKKFGEKGWGLFNLQTMAVIMAGSQEAENKAAAIAAPLTAVQAAEKTEEEIAARENNSGRTIGQTGTARQAETAGQTETTRQAEVSASQSAEAALKVSGTLDNTEVPRIISDTVKPVISGVQAVSGSFIDRLSLVVDDVSIRVKPVVAVPEKKIVPPVVAIVPEKKAAEAKKADVVKQELAVKDSAAVKAEEVVVVEIPVVKTPDVVPAEKPAVAPLKSNVVKKSMTELKDGYMGVFIDEYSNGRRDTVRVFVPKLKGAPINPKQDEPAVGDTKTIAPAADAPKDQSVHFLDFSLKNGEGEKKKKETTDSLLKAEKNVTDLMGVEANSVKADTSKVVAMADLATPVVNNIQNDAGKAMTRADSVHVELKAAEKKVDSVNIGMAKPPVVDSVIVAGKNRDVAILDSAKPGAAVIAVPADERAVVNVVKDSAIAAKPHIDETVDSGIDSLSSRIDSVKVELKKVAEPAGAETSVDELTPASDADFLDLRRLMASEAGEDDMVYVARKYFKKKTFSAAHIRNLGALFLKEEGLYSFLDAAYPAVTDKDKFSELENMLKDPYYIKRFKALIAK